MAMEQDKNWLTMSQATNQTESLECEDSESEQVVPVVPTPSEEGACASCKPAHDQILTMLQKMQEQLDVFAQKSEEMMQGQYQVQQQIVQNLIRTTDIYKQQVADLKERNKQLEVKYTPFKHYMKYITQIERDYTIDPGAKEMWDEQSLFRDLRESKWRFLTQHMNTIGVENIKYISNHDPSRFVTEWTGADQVKADRDAMLCRALFDQFLKERCFTGVLSPEDQEDGEEMLYFSFFCQALELRLKQRTFSPFHFLDFMAGIVYSSNCCPSREGFWQQGMPHPVDRILGMMLIHLYRGHDDITVNTLLEKHCPYLGTPDRLKLLEWIRGVKLWNCCCGYHNSYPISLDEQPHLEFPTEQFIRITASEYMLDPLDADIRHLYLQTQKHYIISKAYNLFIPTGPLDFLELTSYCERHNFPFSQEDQEVLFRQVTATHPYWTLNRVILAMKQLNCVKWHNCPCTIHKMARRRNHGLCPEEGIDIPDYSFFRSLEAAQVYLDSDGDSIPDLEEEEPPELEDIEPSINSYSSAGSQLSEDEIEGQRPSQRWPMLASLLQASQQNSQPTISAGQPIRSTETTPYTRPAARPLLPPSTPPVPTGNPITLLTRCRSEDHIQQPPRYEPSRQPFRSNVDISQQQTAQLIQHHVTQLQTQVQQQDLDQFDRAFIHAFGNICLDIFCGDSLSEHRYEAARPFPTVTPRTPQVPPTPALEMPDVPRTSVVVSEAPGHSSLLQMVQRLQENLPPLEPIPTPFGRTPTNSNSTTNSTNATTPLTLTPPSYEATMAADHMQQLLQLPSVTATPTTPTPTPTTNTPAIPNSDTVYRHSEAMSVDPILEEIADSTHAEPSDDSTNPH